MTRKTFEVEVNPELIKWSIETSGWNITELSKKLKVSEETIQKWIIGKKYPTFKQLETLSKYVKRPLSVFFLPYPPEEKPLPKDYRMLPGKEDVFHRDTILAIRVARKLQRIAKDLLKNLGISPKPNIRFASLESNPRELAKEYREFFQVSENIQRKWKNAYEAFNFLRKSIEGLNIFVFQISMPIEDARGFTLADEEPFVIVINSKENIEPRLFTLMHEFGHILLKESSIDMPEESLVSLERKKINRIEKWCNEFASEFLFPTEIAKKVFEENKEYLFEKKMLRKLSRKFRVSKTMLLYKMVRLGYLTRDLYEKMTKEIKVTEKEGFILPDKKCLAEKGERFISLVELNLQNGTITFDNALEYLGVKAKYYEKIISSLGGG
ncbi:MAG: ImmA/IrrE family metallo-endopeptidase [Candidatus Odinarchaeota archaeon]|nr:ImmA/IrrE family metallo-endopeptidase [Candidatus Odinarchaeota archaeon]